MLRRLLAVAMAVAIVLVAVTVSGPAYATSVSEPLRKMIAALPVAPSSHVGSYDRDQQFGDWQRRETRYGDCDTRALVLIAESKKPTTRNSNCTVITGKWVSMYDGKVVTYAYGGSQLQVDHMVPVENAWISGGWRWTKATRVAFYNDLADPRSLNAVSSSSNDSKSDLPPQEWMPSKNQCRYIVDWVAVKTRWSLTVTEAEKYFLAQRATSCANVTVRVTKAAVVYR